MHAFIIHRTVPHFGKSVPNLLRQISNNKVTADVAAGPADVFCSSSGGSDGIEKKREMYTEAGTSQACADKIQIFKVILGWLVSWRGAIRM